MQVVNAVDHNILKLFFSFQLWRVGLVVKWYTVTGGVGGGISFCKEVACEYSLFSLLRAAKDRSLGETSLAARTKEKRLYSLARKGEGFHLHCTWPAFMQTYFSIDRLNHLNLKSKYKFSFLVTCDPRSSPFGKARKRKKEAFSCPFALKALIVRSH